MTFVSASKFHVYLLRVITPSTWCLDGVLNVKVVVAVFNKEKALV